MKINKTIPRLSLVCALVSCHGAVVHNMRIFVNFDYGLQALLIDTETGEQVPVASPLLGGNYYDFGVEDSKKIPGIEYDYLIPGDIFSFEHNNPNNVICTDSYPGYCSFSDNSIVSAQYIYTDIIRIDEDSIERNESGGIEFIYNYVRSDQYVIISPDLRFVPLAEYKGETLFASRDTSRILYSNKNLSEPQPITIGALFSFNPRPDNIS